MIFRPFYYYDLGCASYLLGCGTLGACAVVDPRADDVAAYDAFAASKGMRITHVIDTHVHADHRSGAAALAGRVGARHCLMPQHPNLEKWYLPSEERVLTTAHELLAWR